MLVGIGGQGVIEGVMVRNKDKYVLALRKEDNSIGILHEDCKYRRGVIPLIRGIFAFWGELFLWAKVITTSSDYREEHSKMKTTTLERIFNKIFGRTGDEMLMGIIVLMTVIFSIVTFVILPFKGGEYVASNFSLTYNNKLLVEAGIRGIIFFIYLFFLLMKKDVRRMAMYHGAEHKVLNCIKNGQNLTIENVKRQSKIYRGCNSDIIFVVGFFSIVLMGFLRDVDIWKMLGMRIGLIFAVAAISYEFVRLSGRIDNGFVKFINIPSVVFQALFIKNPKEDMIEVAIEAIDNVFDWEEYIESVNAYSPMNDEYGYSENINGQNGRNMNIYNQEYDNYNANPYINEQEYSNGEEYSKNRESSFNNPLFDEFSDYQEYDNYDEYDSEMQDYQEYDNYDEYDSESQDYQEYDNYDEYDSELQDYQDMHNNHYNNQYDSYEGNYYNSNNSNSRYDNYKQQYHNINNEDKYSNNYGSNNYNNQRNNNYVDEEDDVINTLDRMFDNGR